MSEELSVYSNGVDFYIAFSPEDAEKVYQETVGEPSFEEGDTPEWKVFTGAYLTYESWDKDEAIAYAPEGAEISEVGDSVKAKATTADWINKLGRGYFRSNEW
jgi:hypothetical protein